MYRGNERRGRKGMGGTVRKNGRKGEKEERGLTDFPIFLFYFPSPLLSSCQPWRIGRREGRDVEERKGNAIREGKGKENGVFEVFPLLL